MTTKTKKRRVRIVQQAGGMIDGPRDWDNLGTMVCWHERYKLGDEQPEEDSSEWLRSYAAELVGAWDADAIPDEHVQAILDKHAIILPLYLYDHSGLSISTGAFSCPWDSGQVGWIVCDLAKARENWPSCDGWGSTMQDWRDKDKTITLRQAVERALHAEVETYDQHLCGDVYGFIVEEWEGCEHCDHGEWEHVDSCWGFYGSDVDDNGIIEHLDSDLHEQARNATIEYN